MKYENEVREIIRKTVAITEPIDKIDADANLQNAGINSIAFVMLIVEFEGFFDVEFPDDKFAVSESGTIRKICEVIASLKNEKE